MLTLEAIQEAVRGANAGAFGAEAHYYAQIGSTNDILREMAEKGAAEGTLVITDEQVAGRGRMGRSWIAPAGTSLLMSVLFRPQIAPQDAHRLVMVAGLAAAGAAGVLTDVRVDVKWPNDLQVGGKKLAGILPESAIEGDKLKWVIIGMGINVNQVFEADDPLAERATSLAAAVGHTVDRLELLRQLLVGMNRWSQQLRGTGLRDAWRDRCVTLGKRIEVRIGAAEDHAEDSGTLVGIAEDIDDNGALWLRTEDGQRHHLTLGEATLVG